MSNFNPLLGCCGRSSQQVCGDFTLPVGTPEDKGICHTIPVKITCEAPAAPEPGECGGAFVYIYNPDGNPQFVVQQILFDSNCEEILDSNSQTILTTVS